MSGSTDLLNLRTFCVITGASKGLGKGIALKFAGCFADNSHLLLLSRDIGLLEETKELICSKHSKIRVTLKSVDLAKPDGNNFSRILNDALGEYPDSKKEFEQAMIIHNAGSVGNIGKWTYEMEDMDEWRQYFELNLNSVVCLNSAFLKIFPKDDPIQRTVINITSLAALHPFKSWGYYCIGKAARDMFFRVLASEDPSLRVLSYAPGPLKTDMTIKIREESADNEVRQWMKAAYDEGKLLEVAYTVDCLILILKLNKFKNGDHVDVEDLEDSRRKSISA